MSVKDFREQGYLQELNRRFLHPLGLALEIVKNPDGTETFGDVWDERDDPEGIIFGEGMIDPEKANRIDHEGRQKGNQRMKLLGYQIQPPD